MGTCEKQISYFMGSNTPVGFISRFSQLVDPRMISTAYVLKAGPGTGKSSLMRRFADFFEQKGYEVHRIYCSSDIQSLDPCLRSAHKNCFAANRGKGNAKDRKAMLRRFRSCAN